MPIESTCNVFYFKLAPGKGAGIWYVEFYYQLYYGDNYWIYRGNGSCVEKGLTDKPFTVNAAKVLLIDHIEKIHIDENSRMAKKKE